MKDASGFNAGVIVNHGKFFINVHVEKLLYENTSLFTFNSVAFK